MLWPTPATLPFHRTSTAKKIKEHENPNQLDLFKNLPDDFEETYSEMTFEIRNNNSDRSKSLKSLCSWIKENQNFFQK